LKGNAEVLGRHDLPTPKKLMQLQETINDDLAKARLPEIRIDGFRHPDQALEITFERETVTGENKDRLWEIINAHYKKLLRDLELKE
jgi:hypothetical protein